MKRYIPTIIGLLSFVLLLNSCKKDDPFQPDFKYDYFPVDSGHWVIYDVDSIFFDDFNMRVDTFHYQIRELIESTFIDNENRETQRIERYRREDSASLWQITDVWFANRTRTVAEKVEENLRFIKLVFPLEEGKTWFGNQYIDATGELEWMEEWEFEITALDEAETINGMALDSVLTVSQTDQENPLEKIFAEEKYARGVGLVYKELWHLEKQNFSAPWTEAEKGFILKMTVHDYKK